MVSFANWLRLDERSLVDPSVLESYERAFRKGLETLIQRTHDPQLRRAFEALRQFRFAAYIFGALVRHGLHQQYDIEDCLQRIVFRMLSPVGERGLPRQGLFDVDLNRPYDLATNPLEARFKTFLNHDLRSIGMGRIPALRRTERPASLSIGRGRGDPGVISAEEIPDRPTGNEEELMNDIAALLRQNSTPELPLLDLFHSIIAGEGTRVQRSRFGRRTSDAGRKRIMELIRQYAQRTGNWSLLRLASRFEDFDATKPDTRVQSTRLAKPVKPKYPPDEQDYRSVVDVIERSGRAANLAILGRLRRRWLERPPRDPNSPHANRLTDVLARMIGDGVLSKTGAKFIPGPNYTSYLPMPQPAAV